MKKFAALALLAVLAIYFWNASWLAATPETPAVKLIAHRGVHHTFDRTDLDSDTCTALRIHPPEHDLFENTIPSMQAAFAAGAEIVELDVHPTTDGQFAVMHDWTVDCRTEGTGETRSHDMAYLKTLDVGYGYSADGGETFPLRGKGVGLMPSLADVLAAMPERRFLINFKSNEEREAAMLADLAEREPEWRTSLWGAYGGDAPTLAAQKRLPALKTWTRRGLFACLGRYVALGWSGYVPEACRNTMVMLPINVAPWLWGWPNRFQQRLAAVGSEIILLGPYGAGDPGTAGIDDLETLDRVPTSFDGYVWTNRIEIIGPALASR
ncbi:glycerophosphodiester phosphodiesterase family protein [Neoaquamicrobium sediminum]|uniref:glycerophosphodiester phosphodiesterase family protein n=1 Tax=Neoaquamicrobium sediminum TaxID=1849104 RepID=UPI003BAC0E6A